MVHEPACTAKTPESITAEDVLGNLIWRMQNRDTIPPRILCLSEQARARNRELAREVLEQVRRDEAAAADARAAGNPRAYFAE